MLVLSGKAATENAGFSLPFRALRPREWGVLLLIANGLSTEQIADSLSITEKSVENYRNRIGRKLHLTGTGCLTRFALLNQSVLQQNHALLFGSEPLFQPTATLQNPRNETKQPVVSTSKIEVPAPQFLRG
jgi:DNA-binding CsgD family transcriptional regulator